jgi:hypothetical protein
MIRTNKLNIKLNYKEILNDFSVVKFTTTEKYIPNGALFIDEFPSKTKALSVVFSGNKAEKDLYVLFDKQDFLKISLTNELSKIKNGEVLKFEKINTRQNLEKLPQNIVSQLLINTISSPQHKSLSFNNLSGHFYSFHNSNIRKNKKGEISQIIGLQFKINHNLDLELNVKTFTSLDYKNKLAFTKKMPIHKYPKYTLSTATNTLRRKLPNENEDNLKIFIIKQFKNKKNIIPFVSFASLSDFNSSKMGLLMSLITNIENKISKYIELSFTQISILNNEKFNRLISKVRKQYINSICENITLNFTDTINDDFSSEWIDRLSKEFSKYYSFSSIKFNKKPKKDYWNIRLIHNKDFYEKNKKEDDHLTDNKNIIHNITFEDFEISKASIDTLIKELLIKKDVFNRKISIIDWKLFNFKHNWIFGNKVDNIFYFVKISPDGLLDFIQFEPNLFNQNEFDKYTHIFEINKDVEGIIINNENDINTIVKTTNITIPKFEEIYQILYKENEYFSISKYDLIESLKSTEIVNNRKEKYLSIITNCKNKKYERKDILDIVRHKLDRKKLSEILFEKKGVLLKAYLRDKTRYEILQSNLDIITFKEKEYLYYFVGTKGEGIQSKIPRASVIRKIESYENSKLFFHQLLPLMNVDFVKNGDLTVKPFPFKYLEEWIKMNK